MSTGSAIIVGVGPGLGLAIARKFSAVGHPTALLARDQGRIEEFAADIEVNGGTARAYQADVSEPQNLRNALDRAIADLGAPDVLVYNAGVVRMDKPTEGDFADWAHTLAVNVLGAKVATDTVLPALRDGRGSLLFTGGGLGIEPKPSFSTLSMGKAALRSYVHTLHDELSETGVHVTSVQINGEIGGPEARFAPETLAQDYVDLHREPRDVWKHELLRF